MPLVGRAIHADGQCEDTQGTRGATDVGSRQRPARRPSQRSAQSDCAREVERRGYTVLSTGNFEQSRDGWQLDMQGAGPAWPRDGRHLLRRDAHAATSACTGSAGAARRHGGTGSSSTARRKTRSTASASCRSTGRARLVKRKSDAPCIEGQTWGQRGDRVWVTAVAARASRSCGGGGGAGQRVECRSQNSRYTANAPFSEGFEGRSQRDYSGRCRETPTWGNAGTHLGRPTAARAASNWCGPAAAWRVRGNGNAGQQQRAEVQCRNQAQAPGHQRPQRRTRPCCGSVWETVVDGTNGQPVRPTCRFYPGGNRAELVLSGRPWRRLERRRLVQS